MLNLSYFYYDNHIVSLLFCSFIAGVFSDTKIKFVTLQILQILVLLQKVCVKELSFEFCVWRQGNKASLVLV